MTPILEMCQFQYFWISERGIPSIESAKIGCHQRKGEAWSIDILRGTHISGHIDVLELFLR